MDKHGLCPLGEQALRVAQSASGSDYSLLRLALLQVRHGIAHLEVERVAQDRPEQRGMAASADHENPVLRLRYAPEVGDPVEVPGIPIRGHFGSWLLRPRASRHHAEVEPIPHPVGRRAVQKSQIL